MGKIKITKEDIQQFRSTRNGRNKYIWMYIGMIIDFFASLGVSFLIIKANDFSSFAFYGLLFILLVIIVLGGELIGVYFGAVEQYFYDKYQKKVLNNNE